MNEPDSETIARLLTTHRRTLAALLAQAAQWGAGQLPASIAHDIGAARAAISRLKAMLHERGIPVADEVNDAAPRAAGDIVMGDQHNITQRGDYAQGTIDKSYQPANRSD